MFFPTAIWRIRNKEKKIFITFDDGPIPEVNPWVIECLKSYNAVATFFCIGENIGNNPEIFNTLYDNGMATGNHTYSHIKAKLGNKKEYLENVDQSSEHVNTSLFRPPYGKIYPWWIIDLKKRFDKIILWSILSLDYDKTLSPEEVANNVIIRMKPGSIIVFHDSLKAWDRMKYALPKVLEHAIKKGYKFGTIE
jgi:peptidoglycan/xylan/chitin deacetylase (PgdA/CDA1 family)